eukprot:scaffold1405_cov305-Prasinococcus_capsulatus_cf.AAC.2
MPARDRCRRAVHGVLLGTGAAAAALGRAARAHRRQLRAHRAHRGGLRLRCRGASVAQHSSSTRFLADVARCVRARGEGGGAGIQADLKTCNSLGVFGMSAVTALTAQNTRGVQGVHAVPAEFVGQQVGSSCTTPFVCPGSKQMLQMLA